MKRFDLAIILIFLTTLFFSCINDTGKDKENSGKSDSTGSTGYHLEITINGMQNTPVLLGYYFNNQVYVMDTVQLDSKGKGIFSGEEPLHGGIYLIYLPGRSYFDVLISDDQDFNIETSSADLINSQKITGSQESANFLKFEKFLIKKKEEAKKIKQELRNYNKRSAQYEKLLDILKEINKTISAEREKVIKQNPGTFLTTYLKMNRKIDIPKFKAPAGVTNRDSAVYSMRYAYYKKHYFDNIDLNDERILRTRIFTRKLDNYFKKVISQNPDTLIKAADNIISKSDNHKVKRYLIQYFFNIANNSEVMGMENFLVYIAEKYYLTGNVDWADSTFLAELQKRIEKMKPNLIGETAPDLLLQSVDDQYFRLSEVYAPITIVVFWEPNCGHCKTDIPKLKKLVWDKYKNKGIKIFAVYTQTEKEPWVEFIENYDLYDWINVYDPHNRSNFRNLYNITSTPDFYVLDNNKKIIGKGISVDRLPGFVDYYLEKQEK